MSHLDRKDIKKSISAIQQYISLNEKNKHRHTANILIHTNRKDHSGPRTIYAEVNNDFASVIIEELHTLCDVGINKFSTQNSSFTFISRTLCIKAKGKLGEDISINIT